MDFPKKLKAIRKAEGLTQREFCEVLQFSESTFRKYEAGFIEVGAPALLKIANHPQFKKYALWLITGDTAPESGQISPI
ncbi:helix-turn-helix transcriptional regulator [Pseudomonas sp. MAFF212428]|uniref:Helix-turn-helix transcriptional regulator n=1 Tax=Pseudomonas brassicae TaxID=2708063 RepID=A0A6B3NJR7_9PSED|nr:helix-turn-helix transcriptional regulator [Pseudomonas brassicae]NER59721.1 helix-turn-helix transcriptional regulator [Pseudomonas brassicae]NER63485.1 helix-turn-helix transcriptional regulator [Pseudomonas brassicae]